MANPFVVPALIGAGGTLLGGILGNKSNKNANQSNFNTQKLADHNAWLRQLESQSYNSHEARVARDELRNQQNLDRQFQKEFAQHGVRWKVDDARAAGISPLAAMGNSTFYSPVAQFGGAASSSPGYAGSGSRSYPNDYSWMGQIGQDIGRAMMKGLTKEQLAHDITMKRLAEEGAYLDNDWKLIRNMQANRELINVQSQVGVGWPSQSTQTTMPGQEAFVTPEKDKVIVHSGGHTKGVHALKQWREGDPLDDGSIPVYSAIQQDAGDAMDADFPTKAKYNIREGIKWVKSLFGWSPKERARIKKPGYKLQWSRSMGQWLLVPENKVRMKRKYGDPRDKGKGDTIKRYKIY